MMLAGKQRLRAFGWGAGIAAALSMALWAGTAVSDVCVPGLPAPLVAICQDKPVAAATVNANFEALVDTLTAKAGVVGTTSVAFPSCTDLTQSFTLTGGGGTVVTGSCPLGSSPVAIECKTTSGFITKMGPQLPIVSAAPWKAQCGATNVAVNGTVSMTARCCGVEVER